MRRAETLINGVGRESWRRHLVVWRVLRDTLLTDIWRIFSLFGAPILHMLDCVGSSVTAASLVAEYMIQSSH